MLGKFQTFWYSGSPDRRYFNFDIDFSYRLFTIGHFLQLPSVGAKASEVNTMFTCVWFRVSCRLAYLLCALLLMLCKDVESNPGPEDSNVLQFVDWRFSQLMNGFQLHTSNIYKILEDKFRLQEEHFRRFTEEMGKIRKRVEENTEEIQELQEDRESTQERLNRLEEKIEAAEMQTRRCNLKFFGVEEPRGTDLSDEELIVDILNFHSSTQGGWQISDIERAYRLGNPRNPRQNNSPRPLLVQFCRWGDKVSILKDTELREALRRNNIRVTTDLTPRQREMIDFHRDQGKVAYFFNGRLHVEDRHPPQPRRDYHGRYSEDLQDVKSAPHVLQEEEWPQLRQRGRVRPNSERYRTEQSDGREVYRRQTDVGLQNEQQVLPRKVNDNQRNWKRLVPSQNQQEWTARKDQQGRTAHHPGNVDEDGFGRPWRYVASAGTGSRRHEDGGDHLPLPWRPPSKEGYPGDCRSHHSRPVVPGHMSYSQASLQRRPTEKRSVSYTDRGRYSYNRRPADPRAECPEQALGGGHSQNNCVNHKTRKSDADKDMNNVDLDTLVTDDLGDHGDSECPSEGKDSDDELIVQRVRNGTVPESDKNMPEMAETKDETENPFPVSLETDEGAIQDGGKEGTTGNKQGDTEEEPGGKGGTQVNTRDIHNESGTKHEYTDMAPTNTSQEAEPIHDITKTCTQAKEQSEQQPPKDTNSETKDQPQGDDRRSRQPSQRQGSKKKPVISRTASQNSIVDSFKRVQSGERSQGAQERGRTRSHTHQSSLQ